MRGWTCDKCDGVLVVGQKHCVVKMKGGQCWAFRRLSVVSLLLHKQLHKSSWDCNALLKGTFILFPPQFFHSSSSQTSLERKWCSIAFIPQLNWCLGGPGITDRKWLVANDKLQVKHLSQATGLLVNKEQNQIPHRSSSWFPSAI